mmetsp:Transcript_20128/g.36388  ORF Transcript_20128/g.36388 Transcript_20128/m.36388 type:complete len:150 (-) Transcript_20128:686-1135(-)
MDRDAEEEGSCEDRREGSRVDRGDGGPSGSGGDGEGRRGGDRMFGDRHLGGLLGGHGGRNSEDHGEYALPHPHHDDERQRQHGGLHTDWVKLPNDDSHDSLHIAAAAADDDAEDNTADDGGPSDRYDRGTLIHEDQECGPPLRWALHRE